MPSYNRSRSRRVRRRSMSRRGEDRGRARQETEVSHDTRDLLMRASMLLAECTSKLCGIKDSRGERTRGPQKSGTGERSRSGRRKRRGRAQEDSNRRTDERGRCRRSRAPTPDYTRCPPQPRWRAAWDEWEEWERWDNKRKGRVGENERKGKGGENERKGRGGDKER